MTITDQDLASQIVMLFPEFTKKYGQEATSWLTIDLDFTQGELVEFTKQNGIEIGMQGGIQVTLGVFANYSTSSDGEYEQEQAFSLRFEPGIRAGISVRDLTAYPVSQNSKV